MTIQVKGSLINFTPNGVDSYLNIFGTIGALQFFSTNGISTILLRNVSNPLLNSDVATKFYVDNLSLNVTGPIAITGTTSSITMQTGSGSVFVVNNSPTLITPNIGSANGTSLVLSGTSGASRFFSTIGDGTAPFNVLSTSLVPLLYVQRSVTSDSVSTINVTGPIAITGSTSSITTPSGSGTVFVMTTAPTIINPTLINPNIGSANGTSLVLSGTSGASRFFSTIGDGTAPFNVLSTSLVPLLYVQRAVSVDNITAGGLPSYVQYNINNLLAGSPNFTFNGTNSISLGTSTGSGSLVLGTTATGSLLLSSGGSISHNAGVFTLTTIATGGSINLIGGLGATTATGGIINIFGGTSGTTSGEGGSVNIFAGPAATGSTSGGGSISIVSGLGSRRRGGIITLSAGLGSTSGNVLITTSTNSTSPSTGSLVVSGGVGISDALYVGSLTDPNASTSGALVVSGGILVKSTTQAINNTTGAVIILGGLGVAKDIFAASFNSPSDITLKKNVRPLENGIHIIEKMKVYSYDWKDDYAGYTDKLQYGLLAQQLEEVGLYNLVSGNSTKSVNYIMVIPLLIDAIKHLNNEIKELKSNPSYP